MFFIGYVPDTIIYAYDWQFDIVLTENILFFLLGLKVSTAKVIITNLPKFWNGLYFTIFF